MRWVLSISILFYAAGVRAQQDPAEPVDLEFLEYLGSLVFGGEGWVGPEDMVVPLDTGSAGEGAAATGESAAATGESAAAAAKRAPAERRVQYEDAFERDLAEEPDDAG